MAAATARLIAILPPSSRIRQAALRRVVVLAVEAYNRRDLEAVVAGYHPDLEYYPYREFVEAALAEPCFVLFADMPMRAQASGVAYLNHSEALEAVGLS